MRKMSMRALPVKGEKMRRGIMDTALNAILFEVRHDLEPIGAFRKQHGQQMRGRFPVGIERNDDAWHLLRQALSVVLTECSTAFIPLFQVRQL